MAVELTFVGTATTVLRLGPFTIMTDPNFLHAGQRASLGYGMWSKRRTEPVLDQVDLMALDAVVLSHMHGDHFDRVARRALASHTPILTTRQAERRLNRWGFHSVVSLSTWDDFVFRRDDYALCLTAVPGQHGPKPVDWLLPDVMGSVLDLYHDGTRIHRMYITGDTLYRPNLAEIAERLPGVDTMLLHLGGTRIAGLLLTMNAAQGVQLMRTIGPGLTVPIHYDDYPVFREPLSRFVDRVAAEGLADQVRIVERGDTLALGHQENLSHLENR